MGAWGVNKAEGEFGNTAKGTGVGIAGIIGVVMLIPKV